MLELVRWFVRDDVEVEMEWNKSKELSPKRGVVKRENGTKCAKMGGKRVD